jgi:hypothetical protein
MKEVINMRSLMSVDFFKFSKILKKMNVKEELKSITKNVTGLKEEEKAQAQVGMEIELLMLFIENIGSAEKEVYSFISDVSEKTVKELQEMSIDKFIEIIKEIFGDDNFKSFFPSALK